MRIKTLTSLVLLTLVTAQAYTQSSHTAGSAKTKTVAAGKEYERSAAYRILWGDNNRKLWTTPVTVPLLWLDTALGGLQPVREGGGHETKSLRVKNKNGEEYTLRSIDKSLEVLVPKEFRGTFLAKRINDQVSMSNPYSALIVPVLSEAAHIYHTNPVLVYLPKQSLLDTFNNKYGDNFYLFEQKANGDWSSADNLGNFKEFFSTDDVIKKTLENSSYKIDEAAFVKDRIFDWFIGDWDRHEGQWDWGKRKINDTTFFIPVPEDRDQAFSKHDGFLLGRTLAISNLFYIQSFKNDLQSVKKFNYEERNLDRFITSATTLDVWQNAAADLQQSLTDNVIDKAVQQLPPEIYKISGREIASTLKARRIHLAEWATTYYNFISEQIQIPGTKKDECFNVQRLNDTATSIQVYNKQQANSNAFYSRTVTSTQTKEVRLFSINGNDAYHITGTSNKLKVRAIGSIQADSFINESSGKFYVYDDKNNFINNNKATRLNLSNDTSVHGFDYNWFKYDKGHMRPAILYDIYDKVYAGFGYQYVKNAWRKEPFQSKRLFDVHYSLTEMAFSFTYKEWYPKLFGNWDFTTVANYDVIRWIRFWGLGNDTKFEPNNRTYFTTRSRQWIYQPGVAKSFGNNTIYFLPFIQGIQILSDTSRFISKTFLTNPEDYKWKTFSGAEFDYRYAKLNDSIVPTKGFMFSADVLGAQNLKQNNSNYFKVAGSLQLYVPLSNRFSYVLRAGGATVTGHPEFYQYNSIGGGPNLRGFRRDRFWGKTTFWNMHDIRFIAPVKSYIYNGKLGVIAFFDNGRVWLPGENSYTWHVDGGAGITLAPFNKILADLTYAFSKDGHLFQIRINKYFGGAGGIRTRVQTSLP